MWFGGVGGRAVQGNGGYFGFLFPTMALLGVAWGTGQSARLFCPSIDSVVLRSSGPGTWFFPESDAGTERRLWRGVSRDFT